MKSILFLTHTINKYGAVKLDGIYTAAKARGWTVHDAEFGWTAWNIGDIVSTLKPDGVIFEGGRLIGTVDLRPLRKLPCIYLDTDFSAPQGNVNIRSDAEAIADLAADELLRSMPAEAAFFSIAPRKNWSKRRARRFGVRMREAKVLFKSLKHAEDIARLRKPFAVFAANDTSAATLLRCAMNLNLACPRDFTLVSVDNETLFCENASPKVTSIEQNSFHAGMAAVEALDNLFQHKQSSNDLILIPPRKLVRRASSIRSLPNQSIAQKVAALISSRALEDFGIADIAQEIGCSRRTIENHYRTTYGCSIGKAILEIRLKEVERLLASPNQRIDAIANFCGWKSAAHLKRLFHQRYGMTMSDWRKRMSVGLLASSKGEMGGCHRSGTIAPDARSRSRS